MALTLPYEFDTTGVVKLILRGILGLLVLVVLPGILYSLFVSHSVAAAVQLSLFGGATAIFARVFFRNLMASRGVLTRDTVVVQPTRLYGLRLAGPSGTFPLGQFEAVRVERVFELIRMTQAPRPHERVWLVGRTGTPDILIARTELGAGFALGHELATALDLPCIQGAQKV